MTKAALTQRIPKGITEVDAYRNLTSGTWSVKAVDGPPLTRGKVVAYPHDLRLVDCTFTVRKGGRDDTRRTCQKWVHAFVRGTVSATLPKWPKRLVVEATYNPYLFDTFVLLDNARPITRAAWVEFPTASGVASKVKPILIALYEDDEELLAMKPAKPSAARVARWQWCRQPADARLADQKRGREVPIANPNPLTLRAALLAADWNG